MHIHCVSSHSKDSFSVVVFGYMLMCVGCSGLVVSTCQVIGWKDPSEDTLTWYSTKPRWKSVCVFFCFFVFGLSVFLCFPPALHNIYFMHLRHDVAYLC